MKPIGMRLTIVSHGSKIQPDQIGKQECVPLRIPRAISYVEGVGRVLTAPRRSERRRCHGEARGRGKVRSLLRNPSDSPMRQLPIQVNLQDQVVWEVWRDKANRDENLLRATAVFFIMLPKGQRLKTVFEYDECRNHISIIHRSFSLCMAFRTDSSSGLRVLRSPVAKGGTRLGPSQYRL